MHKFHTRFNPPAVTGLVTTQPSLAIQSDYESTLIPNIVALHGGIPHRPMPMFDDFTQVPSSYEEIQERMIEATNRFYDLPSALRERFSNDPASLLSFLSDEANRDEASRLGLLKVSPPTAAPSDSAPVSQNT